MSENKLTTVPNNGDLITFDDEKIALIKEMIAPTATDGELAMFIHQCIRTGLDPLARQLYFMKYTNQNTGKETVSYITSIDGYRLLADRTGKYAGNDEAVFEGKVSHKRYQNTFSVPEKATVTVHKIVGGHVRPFSASAHWREYCPKFDASSSMWEKFPHVMLAKCAEAQALRKAFPADLSGVYTRVEMEQSEFDMLPVTQGKNDVVEGEVEPETTSQNGSPTQQLLKTAIAESLVRKESQELISALKKKRKEFHAVGTMVYGDEWDDKRPVLVKSISQGEHTSSNNIEADLLQALIDGMKGKYIKELVKKGFSNQLAIDVIDGRVSYEEARKQTLTYFEQGQLMAQKEQETIGDGSQGDGYE